MDDEATNREAVQDALQAAGCHVVAAESAQDALAQLDAHLRTPDLILTDSQPGAAGDGLLAAAAALGASVLHKPVGMQRLLGALKDGLLPRA